MRTLFLVAAAATIILVSPAFAQQSGGVPVQPHVADGSGVPPTPATSEAPRRSGSQGTVGRFIPPDDYDKIMCDRTGDCTAWHAKQAKQTAKAAAGR